MLTNLLANTAKRSVWLPLPAPDVGDPSSAGGHDPARRMPVVDGNEGTAEIRSLRGMDGHALARAPRRCWWRRRAAGSMKTSATWPRPASATKLTKPVAPVGAVAAQGRWPTKEKRASAS